MIELYKPQFEDLWFRQKFMNDEATMSYNHAWGGTISFSENRWPLPCTAAEDTEHKD